jgi:hypothetical protein
MEVCKFLLPVFFGLIAHRKTVDQTIIHNLTIDIS